MKILVGLFSIMLCLFISGCGNRVTDTKEASGFTDFENIEKEYYRQQMDNARTTSNRLRTENQELKTETKELKKELGKIDRKSVV